jgi:hypothetical protein
MTALRHEGTAGGGWTVEKLTALMLAGTALPWLPRALSFLVGTRTERSVMSVHEPKDGLRRGSSIEDWRSLIFESLLISD